ncbi:Metallophosphoesterase domain protein [Cordyceps fumosorosea ARSEF 2679]|uniref:Metallophosphoesterase domain protein n=1 Tax=Cordyceps fumosorosea (strain ARSEF 2679) TaxID=1081104 RepID=A0A168BNM5_CORFA|nr:Metallophosphoesterase domain protein [Cordyceps fumosorosea ARSEF 2679]OAA70350.1 Metallophosphoesterase domain protein [Cordyceps fumosorosea ARSEF 2679]
MAPFESLAAWLAFAASTSATATFPSKPADLATPVQQRIAIDGPGTTKYYYKIVGGQSVVEQFLSPRAAGDETPFSMNAIIDLGAYGQDGYTISKNHGKRDNIPDIPMSMNHTTIGRLLTTIDDYELIIHPGDLGYADTWSKNPANKKDGENAFAAILERFYLQLAPISQRKPYMVSPGNHEAACGLGHHKSEFCPEGQKNFTDFRVRFGDNMPTAFESKSDDHYAKINANKAQKLAKPPFWFSFDYGMAHVVMIDTETDFKNAPDEVGGSEGYDSGPFGAPNQQLEFLEADLASVDRAVTPWLVVAGHRPWYVASGPGCVSCRAAFEGLFYKYGVDVGVFGHVHNSQRYWPTYDGVADPAGLDDPEAPMYVISGGTGNIEGLEEFGAIPDINAFAYNDDFAYATLRFEDAQHLRVDFIRSATGEVLDTSVLFKSHTTRFVRQGVDGHIEI